MFPARRYFRNLLCLFPDALFEGLKQGGWRGGYLVCCVFILRSVPVPVRLSPVIIIRTCHEAANYLDNFIQGELRHPEVEDLLAKTGGHVVELGVNVGITARWWLALGSQVSLTGIDMIAESLDYTRDRLGDEGLGLRAEFVLGAVGSAPGEIEIAFDDPLEGTNRVGQVSGSQKRRIKVDTVDHLLGDKNQRPVVLLKIDIEGQGGEALRGASLLLARTQWVVIEIHDTEELETSARLLTTHGFMVTALGGRTLWWQQGCLTAANLMSLRRKMAMTGASLRLGRTWGDKLELLRLFAKHGGLMPYAGGHVQKSISTRFEGAPRLHFRDSGPDGILIAELLVEEDYKALRVLKLNPGVILDIGANIGLGSFFLKSLYPGARVFGFEPSPAEGEVLARNYAEWKDCEWLPVAVGNQDGVNLRFAVHPDKTGGQHLAAGEEADGWNYVSVLMRRIDALVDEGRIAIPDLVKIDVEGAEAVVLAGFGGHLGAPAAYILETHSAALHQECLHLLGTAGYIVADDVPRAGEARILCMVKAATTITCPIS